MKRLLAIALLFLMPTALLAQKQSWVLQPKDRAYSSYSAALGLFKSAENKIDADTVMSASATVDSVYGRVITLEPATRYWGDAVMAVDVTENSGTMTTITVHYRRYYPEFDTDKDAADKADFGPWRTLGTITSDVTNLEEFDITADSNWSYGVGHQYMFSMASGTFNVTVQARAYIR